MAKQPTRFDRLVMLALVLFAAASFTSNAADNDLWGHLRFGHDFLAHGLLRTDPYSYTRAAQPWTEHEWGSEIVFAALWERAGAPGLILLKAALGAGAVALLLRLAWETSASSVAVAVVAVPAVLGLFPWFATRPQIWTSCFFAVTLFAILRARRGDLRSAAALPLVVIAWVQLHGGFLAGLGVLGLATAAEAAERWWRREPLPGELLAVLGACLAATLVSPYGPAYALGVLRDAAMPRPDILEWQPLGPAAVRFVPMLAMVPVVLALAAVALAATPRGWSATELVLLAASAVLTLRHARHAPFFFLTALAVLPRHLAAAGRVFASRRAAFVTAAVVGGLAVARVVPAAGAIAHLTVRASAFPIGAVRFLEHTGLGGNVAVDFNWGSYLIGTCYPRCRVSIDGRYEAAYPPELYAANRALVKGTPGWARLLTDYPTEIVLLPTASGGAARLAGRAGWALVYRDPVASVFLRDLPRFRPVIERFAAAPATAPLEDDVLE
ncbi:MAG TPA: hypothetical protein VFD84_05875 [Candidatus Binatia bacterium]|nr:hypothetical protein [Candidatus Binatia bacterium]